MTSADRGGNEGDDKESMEFEEDEGVFILNDFSSVCS